MKKKIEYIVLSCTMALVGTLFSGCSKDYFEEEDFGYYYVESEDCYAAVNNFLRPEDKLFVPAYYRDKEVRYTSFNHGIVIGYSWHYLERVAQETYLPYTHQWGGTEGQYDYVFSGYDLVLNHISVSYAQKALEYYINWLLIVEGDFLLAAPLYDIFSDELKKWQEEEKIKIIGESDRETKIEYVTEWEEIVTISFKKLNVSYLFNYEGEPNAGYFFARGFEAGGKIENTPYEPKREGYTFGGWYKEPECINAWNFDEDKLPEAKQDEEGNAEFVETKLYAKWTKN